MINDNNSKILFFNYESIKTSNGVSSFVSKISRYFKNAKVISLRNKFHTSLMNNEFNLDAFTYLDEVLFISPFRVKKLIDIIKESEVVHININNLFVIPLTFVLMLARKGIIITPHFGISLKHKFSKGIINDLRSILLFNFNILFCKKIVFITNWQKDSFKRYSILKKSFEKKSLVINNFIEPDYIIKSKKRYNTKDSLVFVGRLTKKKGVEDIISLQDKLGEKIRIEIIGDGPLKEAVKKQKNLIYFGAIKNSIIKHCYDKSNIFILPSYSEVFPMTILEAMARGLVILVSDIPGMREIIKEGRNGYLFPPGDVERMKEIILYLKNNPKEIERISKNNLKDIHKFTAEKQVPKYIKVYEEVLKVK